MAHHWKQLCVPVKKLINFRLPPMAEILLTCQRMLASAAGCASVTCGICGGQSDGETGFAPSTSVSPVSIIPPLLHTHPSFYHPRCIMFFSQHFSFPCQYHSTIAPYSSIHLLPTLYNVFLPALQSPLSVSFHHSSILIHPSTTHAV